MNQIALSALAFLGGIFLAIQAGFNSHLGVLLKKPLLAAIATSLSSTVFALIVVLLTMKNMPALSTVKQVPFYLWFTGGLFSVFGISLYFYTIPKLGVSTMISLGLCGQLIFALIAGHFGWLNLPQEPITVQRIAGIAAMMMGILLINLK
ncbi:transporter family-2 protein [Pedobacter africanus]|uniref:Transporter family-2 protein n=1 Tax=Pedobacter africanus TaxID=151894 RepID=A0ACC6KUV1_9SPHI|nr:DMT family transporter [Pedobacter africanus]MDR6782975.1 transporter family-2 protein [Pedobacter africanus]